MPRSPEVANELADAGFRFLDSFKSLTIIHLRRVWCHMGGAVHAYYMTETLSAQASEATMAYAPEIPCALD